MSRCSSTRCNRSRKFRSKQDLRHGDVPDAVDAVAGYIAGLAVLVPAIERLVLVGPLLAAVAAGDQGKIAGGAGVGGCDQWHPEICALTVAIRLALAVVVERVERHAVAVDVRFAFRGMGGGRRLAWRQSRARDENEKAGNEARPVGSRHNLLPRCSAPTYSTSYSTLAQPSGISRSCGKKRPL